MKSPKTLIICKSVHHRNTLKIAAVIGGELDAVIKSPEEADGSMLNQFDLIGFGSGIYNGNHHAGLLNFLQNVECQQEKPAFIFSTATVATKIFHKEIKEILKDKNFNIVGEFICRGFMNYSFTKFLMGGLNKKHPNQQDMADAKEFVRNMLLSF